MFPRRRFVLLPWFLPQAIAQHIESLHFADLTRFMETAQANLKLKGAAVIVGRSRGAILYRRFFGNYTPQTVIPVASVTKWWSAATIEWLAGKKKIDLDRRIGTYLSGVPQDKAAITVRQTLSHISGITKKGSGPYRTQPTLADSARFILSLPLFAPPGTTFQYNGHVMQVAGRCAEVVSGKPWTEVFEEAICRPLELEHTAYGNNHNPALGGDLSTSADELARFLQMIAADGVYNGRRILPAERVRDMERNVAGRMRNFRSLTNGPLTFVGYNTGNWCEVQNRNGECLLSSSYGAYGAYPWVDKRRDLFGVFFVEDNLNRDEPYFKAVRELVEKAVAVSHSGVPGA